MIKNQIGNNAGIVWRTLNASNRKMSINELGAITLLTDIEISMAIGWLLFKYYDQPFRGWLSRK